MIPDAARRAGRPQNQNRSLLPRASPGADRPSREAALRIDIKDRPAFFSTMLRVAQTGSMPPSAEHGEAQLQAPPCLFATGPLISSPAGSTSSTVASLAMISVLHRSRPTMGPANIMVRRDRADCFQVQQGRVSRTYSVCTIGYFAKISSTRLDAFSTAACGVMPPLMTSAQAVGHTCVFSTLA